MSKHTCGFPGAPKNCHGALSYIDNPAHVSGLAGGGHAVVDGRVLLCMWHSEIVCTTMAARGVILRPERLDDEAPSA